MKVAWRAGAAAVVLALPVMAGAGATSARATTTTGWTVSHLFTKQPLAALLGLTATGTADAWAGGDGKSSAPTVVHWNGKSWTASSLPGATARPRLVSSSASNNVWAAGGGDCYGNDAYVSRWNGTAWTTTTFTSPPICASSVVTTGPDDGWLFTSGSTALHYNGKTWATVSLGNIGGVLTAWGVSADDVWALTYTQTGTMQAMNWNGKAWASTPLNVPTLPKGDHPYPLDIAASGAGSVWAVVQLVNKNGEVTGPDSSYLLSWTGTGWQWNPVPGGEIGERVAPDGSSGAWLISQNPITGPFYFRHFTSGTWTRQAIPTAGIPGTNVLPEMYTLALIPGTQSVLSTADVTYVPTGGTGFVTHAAIYEYNP